MSAKLGRWQALTLALSFVVGSGILVLPVLSLDMAGAAGSLQAWMLMTLMSIPLVLIFYRISLNRSITLAGYFTETFGEAASLGARITVLAALVFGMPAMVYTAASMMVHLL